MALKISHRGTETVIADGAGALLGADPGATVRIARPGISRRHVLVTHTASGWVVEDAASKNGTYHEGSRITRLTIDGPTTIRLGHPTEGEAVTLTPVPDEATAVLPEPPRGRAAGRTAASAPTPAAAVDPRLDEMLATLADTVKALRGLTFSVWAMIAVTAVLALLTLFVGILGR